MIFLNKKKKIFPKGKIKVDEYKKNSGILFQTVYRAENKLLTWLLVILGLLMLAAIIALIICCICPTCPFYMAPRKRRIHSSETLIAHSDSRTRRNIHRKYPITTNGKPLKIK